MSRDVFQFVNTLPRDFDQLTQHPLRSQPFECGARVLLTGFQRTHGRDWPYQREDAGRPREQPPTSHHSVRCVLCGKWILRGLLLRHKRRIHEGQNDD